MYRRAVWVDSDTRSEAMMRKLRVRGSGKVEAAPGMVKVQSCDAGAHCERAMPHILFERHFGCIAARRVRASPRHWYGSHANTVHVVRSQSGSARRDALPRLRTSR